MRKNKFLKLTVWTVLIGFIFLNIVAIFQAYKFTHFVDSSIAKTQNPETMSLTEKAKTIVFGIDNPKPVNTSLPTQPFEIITLQSNKKIEGWYIKAPDAKGTVIIFHGYGGQKSSMLDKSDEFVAQGYNTLLIDFMGSGGSEGNQTTIGFVEAEEVKTAFDYIKERGEKNICLFGTSMGAVAILKAIDDYEIKPAKIIIECPFGSMYQTTCARFDILHIPTFPMAGMLVFWGGIENGFWAFGHNPTRYAKAVTCPTLVLYGEQDNRVSRQEIDEIYKNLNGKKELKTYPLAGHEDYLNKYKLQWHQDVFHFMQNIHN